LYSYFYVIIKKLKEEAADFEKFDLIKEAIALGSFSHSNLIKFYGICFDEDNPKYLVLEYMRLGDLLSYLRCTRKLKVTRFMIYSKINL
jgi:serine/threonine protein kinase